MRSVAIYMEGGGPGRDGKVALRQGMDDFLGSLKKVARSKSLNWKLVACGSRNETYNRFKDAVSKADSDEIKILLVDAEELVAKAPRAHLQQRDKWDLSSVSDAAVHLMAQVMETWIVADPDALAEYYGQGFNSAKLPQRTDLEQVSKTRVESALKEATRRTQKGAYHKIKHAKALLRKLDARTVRSRCHHCERLFSELGRIL